MVVTVVSFPQLPFFVSIVDLGFVIVGCAHLPVLRSAFRSKRGRFVCRFELLIFARIGYSPRNRRGVVLNTAGAATSPADPHESMKINEGAEFREIIRGLIVNRFAPAVLSKSYHGFRCGTLDYKTPKIHRPTGPKLTGLPAREPTGQPASSSYLKQYHFLDKTATTRRSSQWPPPDPEPPTSIPSLRPLGRLDITTDSSNSTPTSPPPSPLSTDPLQGVTKGGWSWPAGP